MMVKLNKYSCILSLEKHTSLGRCIASLCRNYWTKKRTELFTLHLYYLKNPCKLGKVKLMKIKWKQLFLDKNNNKKMKSHKNKQMELLKFSYVVGINPKKCLESWRHDTVAQRLWIRRLWVRLPVGEQKYFHLITLVTR